MADNNHAQTSSRGFEPGSSAVADTTTWDDDLLTDEERAALKEEEGDQAGDADGQQQGEGAKGEEGDETASVQEAAADATGDEEGESAASEAQEEGGGEEGQTPQEQGGDEQQQAAAETAQEDDQRAKSDKQQPAEELPDVSQYDQRIADFDEQIGKLRSDFEDGELTEEQYAAQEKKLRSEQRDVIKEQAKAEAKRETWLENWGAEVRSYHSDVPDLFAPEHRDRFDQYVRAVNADQRPQVQAMNHRQRLEYAHRQYANDADLYNVEVPSLPGREQPAKKAAEKPKEQSGKKANPNPTDAQKQQAGTDPNPPQTLANVPSAAISDDGDKFAALDRISDPEAYESALNRLSPADREAYLQQ